MLTTKTTQKLNYSRFKSILKTKNCIYKIINLKNKKVYIGQTRRSLVERLCRHSSNARNGTINRLYSSIRLYGWDNFDIEIIESFNNFDSLNEREIFWIKNYDSSNKNYGYNMTSGGDSSYIRSEESIKKMVATRKNNGYQHSVKTCKRISESNKGKTVIVSQETREKISKSLKGKMPKKPIHETMKGRVPARLGTHHTDKAKRLISEYRTGKNFMTKEGKLKTSIRMTGNKNHVYKDVNSELLIQLLKENTPFLEIANKFSVKPPTLISKIKSQLNYKGYYDAVCDLFYKPKLIKCIVDNKNMDYIFKELNLKTESSVNRKLNFIGFKSIKEARKALQQIGD